MKFVPIFLTYFKYLVTVWVPKIVSRNSVLSVPYTQGTTSDNNFTVRKPLKDALYSGLSTNEKIANMQMPVGIEGRKSCFLQGPCTQQGQRLNTTALCFQDTAGEEVHYLQQLVRRALGGPTSNQKAQGGAQEGVRHGQICAKEGMQTREPNKKFGTKSKYLQESTNP